MLLMKWFDSDYDYIDEFTTQWNERYKKAKRMSIISRFRQLYNATMSANL